METPEFDVVIVGGGPAGLCFAGSLRSTRLRVALVDPADEASLRDPKYDGREIALTQQSARLLRQLAIWDRIPQAQISSICSARIVNGPSPAGLTVRNGSRFPQLGHLVSNHLIRRAAFENVAEQANLTLFLGKRVGAYACGSGAARVELSDGRSLDAKLVVAADSRFSSVRRAAGIGARHHDFGKTMLVCRMRHTVAHEHAALEWFGHDQTLAALPMNGDESSIVVTLKPQEIERLYRMPAQAFEHEIERRFDRRFGAMSLDGERFSYPLVGVYPQRFVAARCALIGDAAVGMHPVTAHGFNFGLSGQDLLAGQISAEAAQGRDVGGPAPLSRYEMAHRRATHPLYLATNAIVGLYTSESPPARLLRNALLGIARRTPPFASLLSAALTADR